jgi:hypothetical protein
MHEYGSLPRARQDGLLEEAVGEELLIYDRGSHIAHCLSPIAACVWRYCNGEREVSELAELAGASESLVADALHDLREKNLLAAEPQLMQSTVPGESRREAIGRAARYGAAAAAGSMIVSATAATPAMASSGPCKGACYCHEECGENLTEAECETFCATRGGKTRWVCAAKCEPPCKGGCECQNKECRNNLNEKECKTFCEGSTRMGVLNWICEKNCPF